MWNVVAGGADPAAPTLHPDAGGLPGAATLQRLADGIGGWALIAAMMGIVVGAVIWASGRRTTTMKFLVTAGCPGGQRPVRPGLRGVSAPSPALVAVTAVWMGPTRSWRPRGAYPRTGVDVAADTGRRPACVGRDDAADRRVAAAATRAEPVRASRPLFQRSYVVDEAQKWLKDN